MSIVETRDGLRVDIEYKTSLFNASTIERMLDHYESLLRSVVAEPMKPGLAILRPGEKRHVVPNQARLISPGPPSLSDEKTNPKPLSQLVRPYLGLQLQLIAIWEDVLGVSGIGIRDNFFDLGGNSLLAIRMLQRAEAACAKVIPPSALFDQPTIEHLAGKMAREIIEESPTLLHVNDGGEQTPFFYLHGDLSGGGFYSLTLSGALGHDQPFYVLPPQDIRVLPVAPTIEEMATAHYDALRTVRPKGPYVIGGFCIGGLVAYELAQQIRAHGDEVEMLLIIDAAPERKVMRLLRSLASMLGALFHWDDDQKVRQFGRWAVWRRRFSQGIAENGDAPTRKESPPVYRGVNVLYEMFRNRFLFGNRELIPNSPSSSRQTERDLPSAFQWASTAYYPRPYDGPITLLLSEEVIESVENPSDQWRQLAPKTTVRPLPGSHLECITEHVETLAKEIQKCLREVGTGPSPAKKR